MFVMSLNTGISEFAVSRAIIELQQHHDLITAEMIADHIGGGVATVYRSIQNLEKSGLLIRERGSSRQGGYRYEYRGE